MEIRFASPARHRPGTVYDLLRRAWEPIWNPELEEKIRRFDAEVREHPKTVGACVFVTCLGSVPVGLGSFDPRRKPEQASIGWNCVLPEYRGRGLGKAQIREILRIFRGMGIRKACVTTLDEKFYVPAQRMYESFGFLRVRRGKDGIIEYELALQGRIG